MLLFKMILKQKRTSCTSNEICKKYLELAQKSAPTNATSDNDLVFITSGHRDLSSLGQTYRLICNKANITNPQGIHTLRHTCASLLIRNHVDIKKISEMLKL